MKRRQRREPYYDKLDDDAKKWLDEHRKEIEQDYVGRRPGLKGDYTKNIDFYTDEQTLDLWYSGTPISEGLLSCLTERQEKVIRLRYEEGLSQYEIAKRLKIHQKTVWEILQAAHKNIKISFRRRVVPRH